MKKIIFMLLLTSCFYGIAFANTGKNKLRSKTSVQNVNKKKVVKIKKNEAVGYKKGNVAKPETWEWECWNFTVSCGSGFVCANSIEVAERLVAAIEETYCTDVPPCEP